MQIPFLISVLLFFGAAQGTTYFVWVKTSTADWAGTDAHVWIKITGTRGETDPFELNHANDDFERGNLDSYTVTGRDVGEVRYASLKRDEHGDTDGWLPIYVMVKKAGGPSIKRYYDEWLPAHQWVPITRTTRNPHPIPGRK